MCILSIHEVSHDCACAQALMDSDVRNLGRLCHFVSAVLPFDPFLVSVALLHQRPIRSLLPAGC